MRNNNENSPSETNQLYMSPLIDRDSLLFPMPSDDEDVDIRPQSIPRVLLLPRLDHSEMPQPEDSDNMNDVTIRIRGSASSDRNHGHSRFGHRHSPNRSPLRDITVDRRRH